MTIGTGVRAVDAGHPGRGGPELASCQALLLLSAADPDPLHLGQGGDRLEQCDGHAGLMVVVVRTQELDAQAGQRPFEGLVRGTRNGRKPYTTSRPWAASLCGVGAQRGSSPDPTARTPDGEAQPRGERPGAAARCWSDSRRGPTRK